LRKNLLVWQSFQCDKGLGAKINQMKRLFIAIAIFLALGASLFAALPLFISSDAVRISILEQTRIATGHNISFRDPPKIFFNPFLGIEINSVIFEEPDAGSEDPPLLQMEQLRGQLDILPLLLGEVNIDTFQFVRPRLNLVIHRDGTRNWEIPGGRIQDTIDELRQRPASENDRDQAAALRTVAVALGEFEIIDGTVEYIDQRSNTHEVFTNINNRFIWSNSLTPLSVAGQGIWRGEAFEYVTRINQPLDFLAGGSTQADLDLKSGAFNARFSGQANLIADLHLSGNVVFNSPSIRRLSKFLGHEMQPGSMLSGFSAQGKLNGTPKQLQLSEASFALDGNQGRGALQITRTSGNKTTINGTLAAETLDFSSYLAAFRQDLAIGRKAVPTMEYLDLLIMDLRISAAQARIDSLRLSDFAASISIKDSTATLNIGNASIYGGTLIGKFELARNASSAELNLEGTLSQFDSKLLTNNLTNTRFSLSGTGNGTVRLFSRGNSSLELVNNLGGSTRFHINNGALSGADLAQLWKTASNSDNGSQEFDLAGLTPFTRLEGEIGFDRNYAWIREASLNGPMVSARIAGRAEMDLTTVALRLQLGEPQIEGDESAKDFADGQTTQLFIGGTLKRPLVTRMPNYSP
jgi:AsmA protein